MKKSFIKSLTKSLMAVGMVGLLGLTSVAIAAEVDWYGSIRAGITKEDADDSNNLGATGHDGTADLFTRIGVRGATDLGSGQTAGGNVEINVTNELSVRLSNLWLAGEWGKLTLGQQDNPYRASANWDQAWIVGGQVRHNDGGSRIEGLKYSSNVAGPFSFDVMVTGDQSNDESIDRLIANAHYDFGLATVNVGYNANNLPPVVAVTEVLGTATHTLLGGGSGTRTVTITEAVKAVPSYNSVVISVNGSNAGLDWYLAHETSSGNAGDDATANPAAADTSITGLFLSYGFSAADKVYLEYEAADTNDVDDDIKSTLLGYSRNFGEGITFLAEHVTVDPAGSSETDKTLVLALKYDF